jgi:predicted anti-sigma-YlaC factor YlaD
VNPDVPAPHVHDDKLQLYILGRLNPSDLQDLEQHLSHCPECRGKFSTAARFLVKIFDLQRDDSRRRSEPRFRATDAGFLRSFSPLLPDRWPVQIIDVSKSGLGLVVPTRLSAGSLVQVQIGEAFALGEVRFSEQIGEGQFHTGIRVQDVKARTK